MCNKTERNITKLRENLELNSRCVVTQNAKMCDKKIATYPAATEK